jgi:hypothetical protein
MAFVLTRPFGATIGDVLTESKEKGDLGGRLFLIRNDSRAENVTKESTNP